MPSIKAIATAVAVGLVSCTSALPALPRLSERAVRAYNLAARQNAAAAALGITDVDILQFALTLENLESTFYQQGFAMFPDSDFAALGLSDQDIANLKNVGQTEQAHVGFLQSALAQVGSKPVEVCQYNFGFTTAAAMVGTAAVLEAVGVSAYMGAAPLVSSGGILSAAAEILTVEARHQTFIRAASKITAIPSPFDTPLGIRSVFSLAAPFISSCPDGSNLQLQAFPPMTSSTAASDIRSDGTLQITSDTTGAVACSFTNGGVPGGTLFSTLNNGACVIPQDLAGTTYVHIVNQAPASGVLTDDMILSGPMAVDILS